MGLTVNRQMAKKSTVNRQKRNIFTVNRQTSEPKLAVKFLFANEPAERRRSAGEAAENSAA